MAMMFRVVYPGGEQAWATGYPGGVLVVQIVPSGPECCYGDEIEVDVTSANEDPPLPVRRVVGGPRRPTIHVRVERDQVAWMDERARRRGLADSGVNHGSIDRLGGRRS